ncbi:MAG TPA: tetratricopeptide repeat protein [Candidatus Obscuribacterales bacterium]
MSSKANKRVIARSLVALMIAGHISCGPPAVNPAWAVDPNVVIGLNNEGVKALNAGNFALAIQKFQEALKLDSTYKLAKDNLAIAHNNYGLQLARSNPQEALKQFHQAYYLNRDNATTAQNVDGIIRMLGKDPHKFEDRVALGDTARKSGDFIGAIIEFSEAVKIKADAKVFTKLGDVYRVRDDLPNAIAAYQNAARAGDSAEVEVKLGQALQAKGDLPSAVKAFGQALAFKPDDSDTLDALQAAWEDALKKDPLAADNHIGLGQALQFRGDFGGAAGEYKQAIALSKGNNPIAQKLLAALPELKKKAEIDKHINNGVDLQTRKLYAPALEEYKAAIGLDPTNVQPWVNMGTCYQAQEDYDKAIDAYSKALQMDPKNAAAQQGYTTCMDARKAKQIAQAEQAGGDLYKSGKYNEAIAKYMDLLKQDPKNAAYHYNLAACYQMLKRFDEAISEYRAAIGLDPKTKTYQDALDSALKAKAEPIIAAAVKKHTDKDYTGAIDLYQQALAIQPNNAPLWFNLASAQYAREDYARARDAYQKALEVDPKGQIDDLYMMAVIDEHFNKGQQALGEYQKYLATAPGGKYLKEAKDRVTALNKNINDTQHIKSQAEIATEKAADDAYQQAVSLRDQKKYDDALAAIDKAIAAMPKEPLYPATKGQILQLKGDIDGAIAQYKLASSIDPKNDQYKKAIDDATADKAAPIGEEAVKLQQAGDLAGAVAKYQQALAILPNNAQLWRNLGSAYQALDQYQQARDAYQKAYNLDNKAEVDNLYYMAVIDETLNQGAKALSEYRQYVQAAPAGQWVNQAKPRIQALAANPNNVQKLQTQAEIKLAQQVDALLSKAVEAYNQKRYDDAIPLYQQVIQLKPKDATLVYSLGALYQAKEDMANAVIWYQKAVDMAPANKDYQAALVAAKAAQVGPVMEEGYKKQLAQDYKGAIELYQKGLQQYPDNAAGWTSLGACYQAVDDFANARSSYQKGYDLDKKSQSENLYFMAVLDENFGQGAKAAQEYTAYLQANPKGTWAVQAQQRASTLKVNPNATQKIQTTAEVKQIAEVQAAYDAAIKLQQEGKYDEAIAKYQEAIKGAPNRADIIYALGTCYHNKNDLDNAIDTYKKALAIDPKLADAKKFMIAALQAKAAPLVDAAIKKQTAATPDLPGAVIDYENALKINPDDAATWMNMGTAYQALNNNPKALSSYNRAQQLDPSPQVTGECYYYRGTLYEAMKQPANAVVEYQKYIKALPSGPSAGACKERIKILAASGGKR